MEYLFCKQINKNSPTYDFGEGVQFTQEGMLCPIELNGYGGGFAREYVDGEGLLAVAQLGYHKGVDSLYQVLDSDTALFGRLPL